MLVTKTSKLTGIEHTRDIPVTEQQLREWMSGRGFIQDVMPEVCPEDREFLISGVTPEEWDAMFAEEA
jgi:hypothetical protein